MHHFLAGSVDSCLILNNMCTCLDEEQDKSALARNTPGSRMSNWMLLVIQDVVHVYNNRWLLSKP